MPTRKSVTRSIRLAALPLAMAGLFNIAQAQDAAGSAPTLTPEEKTTAKKIYFERCAGCHGTAAEFARRSLVVKEGVLTGRRSDRPVVGYLESHGGLAPAERPVMIDTLERVLREVGGS